MRGDRQGEIQLDHFEDEFSLLRESDYWQYLPESTRKEISALLDGNRWTSGKSSPKPRDPGESNPEQQFNMS